jgi:hypothetical protein
MKTRLASLKRSVRKRRCLQPVATVRPQAAEINSWSLASNDGDLEEWKEAESEILEPEVSRRGVNSRYPREQQETGLGKTTPRSVRAGRRERR